MLQHIKAFLFDGAPDAELAETDAVHLAAAALMVEAAHVDESFGAAEREAIKTIVRERFSLTAEESESLLELAEAEAQDTAQWYRFTSTLKDRFSEAQRIEMIEMLWEVVYADGHLHDLESSLLRRIGGLLYVSDRDRGAARKRVLDRLGISGPSASA